MADEDVRLGVGDAQGLGLGACEVVLNAESISAAKHFFQQLDVDASGVLTLGDFEGLPDRWRILRQMFDNDGDGKITLKEVVLVLSERAMNVPQQYHIVDTSNMVTLMQGLNADFNEKFRVLLAETQSSMGLMAI